LRLLFLGDIVGRSGRVGVVEAIPNLRKSLALDFVIVNGENAAGGFGINEEICHALFTAGVDCITTGNHAFDQRDKIDIYDSERRLLRPVNYPKGAPGKGVGLYETQTGKRVLVINAMGRTFMDALDDPFAAVDRELEDCRLGWGCDAAIVDMHAEATSEKMAMGHYCDGRASFVVGTHSHVPTADRRTPAPAPTTTASSVWKRQSPSPASSARSRPAASTPPKARQQSAASSSKPTTTQASPNASTPCASVAA
jgi:metallophosphoesterase (TIGR00282 family)